MCTSQATHRANARLLAVAVAGTAVVYAARYAAASEGETENNQHLQWRCPMGTVVAVIFASGQLSGATAIVLKDADESFSLRRRDEPPASCPLLLYMGVSVISTTILTFVVLWLLEAYTRPRCLGGSASCLRLLANLEQTQGWTTVGMVALLGCQLMGAVAAGRSLACCGGGGVDSADPTAVPVVPAREAHEVDAPVPVGVVECQPAPQHFADDVGVVEGGPPGRGGSAGVPTPVAKPVATLVATPVR